MITKYGQVVIREGEIEITGFHFDFNEKMKEREKPFMKSGAFDVIEWAKKRLNSLPKKKK